VDGEEHHLKAGRNLAEIMNKRPTLRDQHQLPTLQLRVQSEVYHLAEFKAHPFQNDILWVSLVRLLAIVGGVFMLRGHNWARWACGGLDRFPRSP